MSKMIVILAVVAAVAVAGAGVAIVVMNNNQDNTPVATILVEDQNGVYFWTEGKGNTVAEALENTTPGVTVTMVDSGSMGKYITAVNGLEGTTDYSFYWSIYYLDGETWKSSELGCSSMNVSDYPTVGLFYVGADPTTYAITTGGPDNVTVPAVADKVIWDGSTAGTIFAIKGISGLYFYINSDASASETMEDRFTAATAAYKIPFTPSSMGIKNLFGIGSAVKKDSEGNPVIDPSSGYEVYNYWAQFGLIDGAWGYMSTTMPNTDNPNDYAQFAIVYGDGGMGSTSTPLPPIYGA